MSPRRFLALLFLAALVTVCAPIDAKRTPWLLRATLGSDKVGIVGNSVISHASRCDADPRTLRQMLSDDLGKRVQDLSFPGQLLDEAVNLAAVALRNRAISTVVVPISPFELVEWDTLPWRDYLLLRLINPGITVAGLRTRLLGPPETATSHPIGLPFTYAGVEYPDYNGLKQLYYQPEARAMPCPENDGHDLAFVAANYHHAYVEYPPDERNFALLASLGAEARRRGRSLLIVLLPMDAELMQRLDVAGVDGLKARQAHVAAALDSAGLNVLDLTDKIPNSGFADRWCACGHLLAAGRREVALRISEALDGGLHTVSSD